MVVDSGMRCFEFFLGSEAMHGNAVAGAIAVPGILPLLGFHKELGG